MAGLVSNAMGQQTQDPNVEDAMMQGSQQAMPERPGAIEQMPVEQSEEGEKDQNDPGYVTALNFAMKALYESEAAKDIAKAIKLSQDPVTAMADAAYSVVEVADEKTDGAVPDELLVLFATDVLEEIAEIAEAAGVQIEPNDVALAFKQMVLRYVGEQGYDTTQLQQAMDQVNPEEFNAMAMEEGAA